MIRTGLGYDIHQLKGGERLMLGGQEVPYEKGSVGHSDGDVVCHALVDALLGAASLGDIGQYFPSEDDRFKGVSSLEFVRQAAGKVRKRGFRIVNIDCTIILQKPKVGAHMSGMKSHLSHALGVGEDQVSIKATTTDFLGFIGRGEGIGAMAVATLFAPE